MKYAEREAPMEGAAADAAGVDAFADALKHRDPAAYETFVQLRARRDVKYVMEKRQKAHAELQQAMKEE